MHSAWASALMGLSIAGVGTGMGTILSYGIKNVRGVLLPYILSMATGIIFCMTLLEILPESIEIGGAVFTFLGIGLGLWAVHQFDQFSHRLVVITASERMDLFLRSGVILSLAVAIHNFPTGIALGSSLINSPALGKELAITMMLHNIPEGVAIGLPLVLGGVSLIYIFLTVFLIGVPTGIGTYIGAEFGIIWPPFLALLLGLAIGTIIYVSLFEILKTAIESGGWMHAIVGLLIGLLFGLIFIS